MNDWYCKIYIYIFFYHFQEDNNIQIQIQRQSEQAKYLNESQVMSQGHVRKKTSVSPPPLALLSRLV